jgi:hypothetical protein
MIRRWHIQTGGQAPGLAGYWEDLLHQDTVQKNVATTSTPSTFETLFSGITSVAAGYLAGKSQEKIAQTLVNAQKPGTSTVYTGTGQVIQTTAPVPVPVSTGFDMAGLMKNPLVWAGVGLGAILLLKKRSGRR